LSVLALTACGSTAGDDSTSGATQSTSSATTAQAGKSGEDVKVRVITPTPTTAGTWDPSQKAAYDEVVQANGWDLQVAEAVPYGKADQLFRQWGDQGIDVVFSTDNGFQDSLLAAAKRFPDTAWVMMSGLSSTDDLPNVAAYTFNWCEMGYLQGTLGALASKDGQIGAVGPIPILPAQQTVAGQQAGADEVKPGTKVSLKYSGDFIDAQKAQSVVSALIANGADVIVSVTQGGVAPQIAARAQAEHAAYVGTFADEEQFAPKATVGSVVIDFRAGYEQAVKTWLDGNFDPSIHTTGVADGTIKVTALHNALEGSEAQVEEVVEKLKSGDIDWPAGKCADAGSS
jgi:basic membrane lipoprotein Med (substrate-binding protein (PBP1-ABC) superfamily)